MSFLALWCLFKGLSLDNTRMLRWPLACFCFALIVSAAISRNIIYSGADLFKYVSGLLLLIIASSLRLKYKEAIMQVACLGALVISFLAINQYVFEFSFLKRYLAIQKITDPFILEYIGRKRVFFPFLTPNALAGYLGMIIPFFLISKKKAWISIPLFIAFFLTQSIGALLSLLASLGLFLILQSKARKRDTLLFFLFALACLAVFSYRSAASLHITQPLFSGKMRIIYWKQTLAIIHAHPFMGIGLGNFNLCISRYAHNLYLQLWAETGMLGLLSFLWLVVAILMNSYRALRSNLEGQIVSLSLLSSSVFFLLHNSIDFTFYLPEVSMLWWVAMGMGISEAPQKQAATPH